MASITQKENGSYLVRISCGLDNRGKQKLYSRVFKPSKPRLSVTGFQSELQAFIEQFEADLASETGKTSFGKKEAYRFSEFAKEYLIIKKNSLSPTTFQFYENVIETMLIPMYGRMKLKDIKTSDVQNFITYLATTKGRGDGKEGSIAATTVKRYTTVMRSMLTTAYKLEYIDNDVGQSRRIEFPKQKEVEVEAYSMDEVSTILEALEEEPLYIRLVIETALFTGCRRGEIIGLKWEDIDFENCKVYIHRNVVKTRDKKAIVKEPKTKYGIRTIAIPQRLVDLMKQYKRQQQMNMVYLRSLGEEWQDDGYVFTERNGGVMNPHTPTKQFDHFLKRHHIRHLKFHGLRHTSATILLSSGCDIKTVSQRLGHSDIETTGRYVHLLEATDKKAAETFDTVFAHS